MLLAFLLANHRFLMKCFKNGVPQNIRWKQTKTKREIRAKAKDTMLSVGTLTVWV